MEMHQIRYFLAVAETLNFTRAAELCHVSQPSLSRAIRNLEEELSGALFRRERNRTHLTDLGREMQPLLRQAFESAAAAKEHAANLVRSEHMPLRLGLSQSIRLDVIAPVLAELARAFPGLELNIAHAAAADLLKTLQAGEIELLVAAEFDCDWDRLDDWPMFDEAFVLVGPREPAGTAVKAARLDELAIIVRPYCETLLARQSELPPALSERQKEHSVSSEEDAAKLADCGLGVVLMPESSARGFANSAVRIEDFELTRRVSIYSVAGRKRSAAANGLLKLLRAADWTAGTH